MSNQSRSIPVRFRDQISEMPESSYGVTRITVTLDDGTKFRDVIVAWGEEIIKVGDNEALSFDPVRINKVEMP